MENASKALIIAGAILLSILLISLGIMIFTQSQSAIQNSGMSQAEVSAFNSKFTKYDGNHKGSEIRALVQEVLSNNNSDEATEETYVSINADNTFAKGLKTSGNANIVTLAAGQNGQPTYGSDMANTKTYKVSFQYYNGRVAIIDIVSATK